MTEGVRNALGNILDEHIRSSACLNTRERLSLAIELRDWAKGRIRQERQLLAVLGRDEYDLGTGPLGGQ